MRDIIDRWGERTIIRAETGEDEHNGMELILRLKGDATGIGREEIVQFLESVIKAMFEDPADSKGTFRAVSFVKTKKKIKPSPLSDAQKKMIRAVFNSLHERLNKKGRKELATCLEELIQQLPR